MIVGFITIKRSSWNQTVSAPKPRTRIPDIHSIGDILPSFHFDTAIAMTIATMKRSEEHTSELQSLMRNSYAVFCLKKKIYHMNLNILSIYSFHTIELNAIYTVTYHSYYTLILTPY